jgi:anaerobic selenocysteine-containing dehydrogenase
VSAPELAANYPLILDVGRRVAVYTHSRHRNLPSLRKAEPEPLAEVHPATAARYGIGEGDLIEVATLRGRIQLKARLTEHIRPDTVSLLHGWEEANANLLTDDAGCDPILACPPLRSGLCRIARIAG